MDNVTANQCCPWCSCVDDVTVMLMLCMCSALCNIQVCLYCIGVVSMVVVRVGASVSRSIRITIGLYDAICPSAPKSMGNALANQRCRGCFHRKPVRNGRENGYGHPYPKHSRRNNAPSPNSIRLRLGYTVPRHATAEL